MDWLNSVGHDVEWVTRLAPSIDDPDVLDLGVRLDRSVVTFDVRIGRLVLSRVVNPPGVAILRLHSRSSEGLLRKFQQIWPLLEPVLITNLVSATLDKVRTRPLYRP